MLLSYQKNHDPSNQPIKEDEESQDVLAVLRPLKGIEQSKYQPIIRHLPGVKVNLNQEGEVPLPPLKELLRKQEMEMVDKAVYGNPTKVRLISE